MDPVTFFSIIGIVIFIGFVGEYIFDKTNIPDVLWLMLFGVVLGQFFDVAGSQAFNDAAPVFTTFALIFILFEGVLNVDLKKLLKGIIEGTSISVVNFFISMLSVGFIMMLMGWGVLQGMLLGAILADSAQAVIVPLLKKIKIGDEASLILTFESAISDIFCIVGTLTIINIITLNTFSLPVVLQKIVYTFVLAIIFGVIAAIFWIRMLPHMDEFSKSYMTTIAALLILYALVEKMGANGPLASLSFGLLVGNSQKIYSALNQKSEFRMKDTAKFFYAQISFFLKTFFFVYLGLIINLSNWKLMAVGIMLSLLLLMVRPIAVYISQRHVKLTPKDRSFMDVLNPKGLSAAILAQLPLQYGLAHGVEFSTIVMTCIISSVLLSLLGVYLTEKGHVFPFFKAQGAR